MQSKTYSITLTASDELEANRKLAALTKIGAGLTTDNLVLIAGAAGKPGANAKLQSVKSFL
jgi:hypothetical protein